MKFFDADEGFSSVGTGYVVRDTNMLEIPQGDGPSARDGQKIVVKKIQLKLKISSNSQSVTIPTPVTMRIFLILDTQTNGTAMTAALVNSEVFTNAVHTGFRHLDNASRYKILMAKTWNFSWSAGAGDGTAANDWTGRVFTDYFEWNGSLPVEWDTADTTGDITNVKTNSISLVSLCDSAVTISCTVNKRIRFYG